MTDPSEQAGPTQATPARPSPDDQRPRPPRRVRVHHLREAKERGERITMLTAYDAPTAQIFDEVGTDVLLVGDALALQDAGVFAIVLEMVPAPLAARITEILAVPTIGIGAGAACDGQVLVWPDMAGLSDWTPRFAKRYGRLREELAAAARAYNDEVRSGTFPDDEHSFTE